MMKRSELDLSNVQIGKEKYLEGIQMKIEFGSDLPMDIEQYFDKLEKIAEGIELCWKIFSPHSQQFFIKLSLDYLILKEQKFSGFKGLIITLKLMIISWKSSKNLLDLYKRSFLLIPEAVDRALRTT